jgi:hypothetical protein
MDSVGEKMLNDATLVIFCNFTKEEPFLPSSPHSNPTAAIRPRNNLIAAPRHGNNPIATNKRIVNPTAAAMHRTYSSYQMWK